MEVLKGGMTGFRTDPIARAVARRQRRKLAAAAGKSATRTIRC